MKAILWTRYGSPDLLQYGDAEKPIPNHDELLIKVRAATVTPGDCEMRRFDMHVLFWLPLRLIIGIFRPRKSILGMELSGEVEAIGDNVTGFKIGDEVIAGTGLGFGAYAQYKVLKAKSFIIHKPKNISFEDAATLPTGANNALHYIKVGGIKKGEKVLINGAAGCFGTYAVQFAKMYGAEVTAVDNTKNLAMLLELGADHVIDFTKEAFHDHVDEYDLILDIAGKGSVTQGMKALKPEGRYVLATPWVGMVLQGLWKSWWSKKKFIFRLAGEDKTVLSYLADLMESGKIKAVIGHNFPLDETAKAHELVESGEKTGHVSITINH